MSEAKQILEELLQKREESLALAGEFRAASSDFLHIAESLETGNFNWDINATETANKIRVMLSKRNRLVKAIKMKENTG